MQTSVTSTFPKAARLRKRADFLRLANSTNKVSLKGFLVVWQPNELLNARLGITVSKKVGCAVTRNRLKRLAREIFRHNQDLLPSVDMNVIARRDSATMEFAAVKRELEKAFSQIGSSSCSRAPRSL